MHDFHCCNSISWLGPKGHSLRKIPTAQEGEREREENCQHREKPDCHRLFWGLFQITVTYRLELELTLKLGQKI